MPEITGYADIDLQCPFPYSFISVYTYAKASFINLA